MYPDSLDFAAALARLDRRDDLHARLAPREGHPLGSGHGQLVREPRAEARAVPRHDGHLHRARLPALLVLGFLTPLAYGGVCALMVVAFLTNHLKNGFFLNTSTEGYEYVVTVAVVCITLGTVGPGDWSLDNAFDFSFPFDTGQALLITALVGIGGAAVFLATFWRPPKNTPAS